ncbi:unnamed protein product [Allacma fusca]|uniref:Cytochrome P450 n=1 Tax=Allacma fusca TaxID=39272 RepID=A0A8J2JLP0_9HEXA|nr:unnamed protein product [Allacma fusca]
MLLLYATAVLAAFIVGAILYARWHYGELESVGIPTVKPGFLFGSDPNIHDIVVHEKDYERFKQFGDVWGVYEGRAPQVFIADAEIARQILIKDFEDFRNRRLLDFGHELINEMLDVLPYETWKVVRTAVTPSFTTGKIRGMSKAIEEAVIDCVNHVDKEVGDSSGTVMDMKKIFSALTTDVIARCVFGMNLNAVNDDGNAFVKATADLTGDSEEPSKFLCVMQTFPILAKGFPIFPVKALDFFGGILRNVIKTRREENILKNDMIDTLNEMMAKLPTPEFKQLNITETTVLCQALSFLLAGFETTATTLTMLSYYLATNPDKQKKLIEELDQLMETSEGKINHDNLSELPYMSACINETLRLVSPLIRVERVCAKDWKHESGLIIKKGWAVMIPSHSIHRNEKYWLEPHKYLPERFMPENKDKFNPYAFMAFGQGPRNCVGSRFAKEELIYSLALILKDYQFEATDETKLEFKKGRFFLAQYQPVKVKIARRQK